MRRTTAPEPLRRATAPRRAAPPLAEASSCAAPRGRRATGRGLALGLVGAALTLSLGAVRALGAPASPALPAPPASLAPLAPPWLDPDAPQLPEGTRSARVRLADQPILAAPWDTAPRRGSVARDVRLPVFAARRGAGCRGAFLSVGPSAWVCDEAVELGPEAPIAPGQRAFAEASDGLPYRYFFVGPEGSLAYRRLGAADLGEPDMELEPGFAVAIAAERAEAGARYGRTPHELWIPMRDLGPARSFAFQGEAVAPGATSIDFAWVITDRAKVLAKPSEGALTSNTLARFERVSVLEEAQTFAGKFIRIGDGAWLAAKDLRRPAVASPPAEVDVAVGERWIDVDLATQTLIAYEGRSPVFATLVSTGKGRPGSLTATPTGTHRIWVKILTADMDNLEDENAARYYRMESVPWVQYFAKGVGLHGAFWHRSFGDKRSHGCVNLAPIDAQRLFWWTGPHLPAGWTAALPTAHERGTVVRVR